MIDAAPLLKIMPIFIVALAVPGPDFFLVSSTAMSRGRWAGFLTACGIACGNTIYATVSMMGLGVVLMHMHWLAIIIRICGGLYLTYLSVQLWRTSFKPAAKAPAQLVAKRHRNPLLAGFLTNMTNPKAMAFFTSIFALTLPSDVNTSTQAALVAEISLMSVIWFGFVAWVLAASSMRKVYMQWTKWIDRAAGTFLAFFGLRLLYSVKN